MTISGDNYYAAKYWDPDQYQALQDSIWDSPLKHEVDVGELRQGGVERPE